MRRVTWSELKSSERTALFAPAPSSEAARDAAIEIVDAVRREGSRAVFDYARRLDGFAAEDLRVSSDEIENAWLSADRDDIRAIQAAIGYVWKFHASQGLLASSMETWPGVKCERWIDPLQSVGLYVPAGSAPLVSTLIMLAVPAKLAGVPEVVVAVPPDRDGAVNSSVLTAAKLLGLMLLLFAVMIHLPAGLMGDHAEMFEFFENFALAGAALYISSHLDDTPHKK